MSHPRVFGLALAAAMIVATVVSAEPVSILLQEGIFNEESLGDLDAAIQVYEQIVSNGRANGQQAPQAHYRLGMCYLKQGKRHEAAAAFERLVKEFPEHEPYVSQARSRLVELGIGGNSAPASGLILRKVWPDVSEDGGGVSPDARYISFTDWTTGELYLGDLTTGKRRCLTKEGFVRGSDSAFSPDGSLVAYTRHFQDTGVIELCIVGLDGSEPRVLLRLEELAWLDPVSWSLDGKSIVGVGRRKDKTNQIVLISVADGSIRTLKSLVWPRFPGGCWFSPDGRHIVYHTQQDEGSAECDIFVLATDGTCEIPLIENPADDQVLGWAPDGKHILFVSDRTGTKDAWLIRVADGKPEGSPKLIKPQIGVVRPWGFARNGFFYYSSWGPADIDIYLAKLDTATGMVQHPAVRADLRYVGCNSAPDWSRDGSYFAYHSLPNSTKLICLRSVEGEKERQFISHIYPSKLRWSPDGKSLLTDGYAFKTGYGFFQIDAQSGETTTLSDVSSSGGRDPAWSQDGKGVFFARRRMLMYRELESGQETNVYRAPEEVTSLALSPDGRRLAFVVGGSKLLVVPSEGGEPQHLHSLQDQSIPHWYGASALVWTADSSHLLFGAVARDLSDIATVEVWRISAAGGQAEPIGLTANRLRDLRVHPNGHDLAFVAGGVNAPEVWVMEGFLP